VPTTDAAIALRDAYLAASILDDALQVALATVSGCSVITSRNFRHIVHFDRIPLYNPVNVIQGYAEIRIYSPLEVIAYANEEDV